MALLALHTPPMASLLPLFALFILLTSHLYHLVFRVSALKNAHETNMSFWSPAFPFVRYYYLVQLLLQILWTWRFWKLTRSNSYEEGGERGGAGNRDDGTRDIRHDGSHREWRGEREKQKERETNWRNVMAGYAPFYVVGNLCLAIWDFVFSAQSLGPSTLLIAIVCLSNLYYVLFRLPPLTLPLHSPLLASPPLLTHLVCKTAAAMGILQLLQHLAILYNNHQRSTPSTEAVVCIVFTLAALVAGDWIFGLCLIYCVGGMAVGQLQLWSEDWALKLGLGTAGLAVLVLLRNLIVRPYKREPVTDHRRVV